ncbi:MAG: DUF1552 domain-containing protein [Planctomycetota bacterium]|nr:DUF1552 domain-containing protein [Planctomycetota bacterium]MDA1141967.1 DUF1552 domain-containing protein [Planctomycetota bacterium]
MPNLVDQHLSRRTVLRGLGASISLPLLDAMLPRAALGAPSQYRPLEKSHGVHPRMICCYVPNGVNITEWMPTGEGLGYEMSPTLQVLKAHRKDFTVISGLGHPASKGGHSGADTWLTGADLAAVPGSDYANSVSADQIVAQVHGKQTRFPSLQLSDTSGTGSAGHSHTLSFDRSGTPLPAEDSPQRLFDRLFVPDTTADRAATLRRYAEKKSILDSVLSEANALHKNLGSTDQKKLDQYLTSVRETEQRVRRLEAWIDIPKPNIESRTLQLNSQPHNAHDRPMWIDVMLEIAYLAFLTDTTRVISFEWSREAGGFGGGGENHHQLSHHGGDAEMLKGLGIIDRFHLERLGRFIEFLKSTADGDGNMLDHTLVLYGSGMNSGKRGDHSPKNLPTIIAGGQKLGIKQGQHLKFDEEKHPPFSNLLLSLVQMMGVETDSFRDSKSTLTGLS